MNIELGEAYRKPNGNIVKVTLNEFRDISIFILENML